MSIFPATTINETPYEPLDDQNTEYEYNIFLGYFYLLEGSLIIVSKHLIIDPIQDTLIKLGLDNSIKYISNLYSYFDHKKSVTPTLETGTAHALMHQFCAPILTPLELKHACHCHQHYHKDAEFKLDPQMHMLHNALDATHTHNTFISHAIAEYVMHASVKALAVAFFPIIYSLKHIDLCENHANLCAYGKAGIKLFGINPLELIYGFHSILDNFDFTSTIKNAEHYLNYQHLHPETRDFLQELDLFLEGIDGFIHGVDNIELLYRNKQLPGFPFILGGMAIAAGSLYYNTAYHEQELLGNNQDLEYNS